MTTTKDTDKTKRKSTATPGSGTRAAAKSTPRTTAAGKATTAGKGGAGKAGGTKKTAAKSSTKPAEKSTRKTAASKAPRSTGKGAAKGAAAPKAGAAETAAQQVAANGPKVDTDRVAGNMPHIPEDVLAQIIAKLKEMRDESLRVVRNERDPTNPPWEKVADVGDDLDIATNERDREFGLIMHQRHLRRLQQIDEAFEKMEEGTYGLCEGTEEPINPRRLLAMPLTRYSLEYQEHQEKIMGRGMEEEAYSGGGDESFDTED